MRRIRITFRRGRGRGTAAGSAAGPADLFLGLVSAAVVSRDAHLLGEAAELPDEPEVFGWHTPPGEPPRPGGICIGVAASGSGAGRRVFLFPAAAFTAAEQAAARLGITMPLTLPQAGAELAAQQLVITGPGGRGAARRQIRGAYGRVWDLPADHLLTASTSVPQIQARHQ